MKKVFLILTTTLILSGAKCSNLEQDSRYYNYESNNYYYDSDNEDINNDTEIERELNDMAKKITDLTNYVPPDTDNPDGRLKDQVYSGATITEVGSKVLADYIMDLLTLFYKIMREQNPVQTPSGSVDTETNSQFYNALEEFIQVVSDSRDVSLTRLIDGTLYIENGGYYVSLDPTAQTFKIGDSSDAFDYSRLTNGSILNSNGTGSTYKINSGVLGGGVYFGGSSNVGVSSITTRKSKFLFTASSGEITITNTGGITGQIRIAPTSGLTLTGIPSFGIDIHSAHIRINTGSAKYYLPVSISINEASTDVKILDMTGVLPVALFGLTSITDGVLYIDYDPSQVD